MALKSFRGGVRPAGGKELTRGKPIQFYLPKGDLVFPLSQHTGKPAVPVVKKGDPVLAGQVIAKADGYDSANIISSGSGRVKAIEARMTTAGVVDRCIVIENDGQFTLAEGIGTPCNYQDLTDKQIIQKIMDAGVIGLGQGITGVPTHVKLTPEHPEDIDSFIANGSECEPYITCDEQLMAERPEWVVGGLKIALRLFPEARASSPSRRIKKTPSRPSAARSRATAGSRSCL